MVAQAPRGWQSVQLTLCWLTYLRWWCIGDLCLRSPLLAPALCLGPTPLQTSPIIIGRNHIDQRKGAKTTCTPGPYLFCQIQFPAPYHHPMSPTAFPSKKGLCTKLHLTVGEVQVLDVRGILHSVGQVIQLVRFLVAQVKRQKLWWGKS